MHLSLVGAESLSGFRMLLLVSTWIEMYTISNKCNHFYPELVLKKNLDKSPSDLHIIKEIKTYE